MFIEYKGERKTLAQWAETINMKAITLGNRLRNGWDIERALTEPLEKRSPKVYKQ